MMQDDDTDNASFIFIIFRHVFTNSLIVSIPTSRHFQLSSLILFARRFNHSCSGSFDTLCVHQHFLPVHLREACMWYLLFAGSVDFSIIFIILNRYIGWCSIFITYFATTSRHFEMGSPLRPYFTMLPLILLWNLGYSAHFWQRSASSYFSETPYFIIWADISKCLAATL